MFKDATISSIDPNTFRVVVPADLEKGADGEWKVRGLASTEKVDQQGETLIQKGIDLTPIDKKKGIINFDHARGPENTIGLLDGYKRTPRGLYIEGRLFKNHSKAKAVYEIMSSLSEGDRGRVGLSVEGKILERDPLNPSVIKKCQISAVAITLNPVNTDTFADIVKSMNAASELEIDAQEQIASEINEEAMFTASQVVAMVKKALSVGPASMGAPSAKTGGDALQPSDMSADKKKKKKIEKGEEDADGSVFSSKPVEPIKVTKAKMKKMDKCMYKSNLITILDKLQILYPNCSRSEIWEAVKERLDTKFEMEKGFRIKNTSGKEREHKLYEDARQREDYERNKDKSRVELNRLAEESGASKHDKEKIRAQHDAAIQVGERDHVRPNVKS